MKSKAVYLPTEEDQKILGVARENCVALNITKYQPLRVFWLEHFSRGMFPPLVGSDECVVAQNAIVLARRMQGKLEAKEWKPIIISSFILSFRLENGVRKKNFVRLILPPLALFLGVLAFSAQFFRYAVFRGPMWLAFLLLLSLLALMLVPTSLWGTYYPEAKLRADRTAAALVGNQVFLDLLRKIDLMAFKDVEKAKGRHIGSARLGIDRRIANLERIDPFVGC